MSLLGRPAGFFGMLGQYCDLILDIVEVLTPVEALIYSMEEPERRREMMLFRLASERSFIVWWGLRWCVGPHYI